MDKIVKITIWVPGQQELNQVLSAAKVHLDCGAPKRDSDGNFEVTLYASPAEARKVAALPFRQVADEKYGDVLAERQMEVSRTDRFQGGKIKPTGLGVKR